MSSDEKAPATNRIATMRIALGAIALSAALLGTLLGAVSYNDGRVDLYDAILAIFVLQPLSIFSFWIQAPRLALIADRQISFWSAFVANSISATLFNILPGRSSEILKPLVLNIRDDLPIVRGLSVLVAERLLDSACVLLLLLVALAGNASQLAPKLIDGAILPSIVLVVAGILFAAISFRPGLFNCMVETLPSEWLKRQTGELLVSILRLGRLRVLAMPALLTITTWLASYLNVVVVSHFLGQTPLGMSQALVVLLAGTLGMVLTVAPGGLGTFEAAIVAALAAYGYPVADGLVIALVLRIAMIIPALPCAAWYLANGGEALAKRAMEWRSGDQKP